MEPLEYRFTATESFEGMDVVIGAMAPDGVGVSFRLTEILRRAATQTRRLRAMLTRIDFEALNKMGPGVRSWQDDADRDERQLVELLEFFDAALERFRE